MAWQQPGFETGALKAGADLSSSQFLFVKMHTTANQVVKCATDAEVFLGVLQNEPASGSEARVMSTGVSKVVAGAAIAVGDTVGTDTAGKAKPIDVATGADVGDYFGGIALESASAANEVISVLLGLSGLVFAT